MTDLVIQLRERARSNGDDVQRMMDAHLMLQAAAVLEHLRAEIAVLRGTVAVPETEDGPLTLTDHPPNTPR